jgi:glycerol-3-phosphate dehydrogenase subunit B
MLGDTVREGVFDGDRLAGIRTVNHGDTCFKADNFILASGSFFSKGLVSDINGVREPVFGLDVDSISERPQWYRKDMFETQPYMSFGVATDEGFHASRNGQQVENLYATGSVLSSCHSMKEGSGAGVAILTALHVADTILKNK